MTQEKCRITVRLKPQSKREALVVQTDNTVVISVSSPPVDGKANAHAIRLLSSALHVPKSACEIVRGHTSKNKIFEISGLTGDEVHKKLINQQTR